MSSFFLRLVSRGTCLALCVFAGCGSADSASLDGGQERDSAVVEAGPQPDAGGSLDGSVAGDASPLAMCTTGECALDVAGTGDEECAEGKVCSLRRDGPSCVAPNEIGARLEGDSCETTSECGLGLACFEEPVGARCRKPCCPGDGSCGAEQTCIGGGVITDGFESTWSHCAPEESCELLSEAQCASGEGCYIVSDLGVTECRRAGDGGVGDPCVEQNDCIPGLFCGGVRMLSCQRICALGTDDCPDAEGGCWDYPHTPDGAGLCTQNPNMN